MNRNVLPWPGALSTQIRPPINSTSCVEMVSPRPVPPYLRVVDPSACVKASKIIRCFSVGMPMPVSRTANCTTASSPTWPCSSTRTTTSPSSVNLMALPIRFTSTCRNRAGSPTSASGTSGAMSFTSSSPFSCARNASALMVDSSESRRLNAMGSRSNRPASIFEKSRMSFSKLNSVSADSLTVSR